MQIADVSGESWWLFVQNEIFPVCFHWQRRELNEEGRHTPLGGLSANPAVEAVHEARTAMWLRRSKPRGLAAQRLQTRPLTAVKMTPVKMTAVKPTAAMTDSSK